MTIVQPPAIFGIGRNYADHAAELNNEPPERPLVFMKNPASIIGHGKPIIIPPICEEHGPQVDYEGELAVVLGRDARDVAEDDAHAYIGGYAVANDISARWWQKKGSGGQFIRGKSFDTFCPLSDPVAASAVADPQDLHLVTRLNDTIMQDASTSQMLFSVTTLIAELSRGMTLLEGTVILTGTPAGVGAAQSPPRFLQDGDVISISIDGVGTLTNTVKAG
ncbi:MAG: fumarylacetoacetate hydrolase family protein [Planctomycetota bacterium]